MSKLLEIDKIQPGMILDAPIINKYGQMLLTKGVVIESRHIMMLKTWGVQAAVIYNDQQEDEGKMHDPELLNKTKEHLLDRMKWTPRNPVEEDMLKAAVELILSK